MFSLLGFLTLCTRVLTCVCVRERGIILTSAEGQNDLLDTLHIIKIMLVEGSICGLVKENIQENMPTKHQAQLIIWVWFLFWFDYEIWFGLTKIHNESYKRALPYGFNSWFICSITFATISSICWVPMVGLSLFSSVARQSPTS